MHHKRGSVVVPIGLPSGLDAPREGSFPDKKLGGPKTVAGKRRSSLNALRSGLYADAVLVKGEDRDDYHRFARAIIAGLDIQTAIEMALAERVISSLWRSRRARRYEQAHLDRFADEAERKRTQLAEAEERLATHEREVEAVARLGYGEAMTRNELDDAPSALANVYANAPKGEEWEKLPDRFWDVFPAKGRASRKRVAAIAAEVREIFAPAFIAESSYDFGAWVYRRMAYETRKLQSDRDEAADEYGKAVRQTFILDATQGDGYAPDLRAGRVLQDAEGRLDRQVTRAIADLEAARRLRP